MCACAFVCVTVREIWLQEGKYILRIGEQEEESKTEIITAAQQWLAPGNFS